MNGALAVAVIQSAAATVGPAATPALRLTIVALAMAVRSVGSTTAIVYDWLVGASICPKNARRSQNAMAIQASGTRTMPIRNRLAGMCVNTMVFRRPMRAATRVAAQSETA